MKIFLATKNPGKISEFKEILSGLHVDLVTCNDLEIPDVEETGSTFVENAILNIDKHRVGDAENKAAMKDLMPMLSNEAPMVPTSGSNHSSSDLDEDDIQTIIEQTGCDKETAVNALKGENNDVISCIMKIDEYKADKKQEPEEEVTLTVEE